MSLSGWFFIRVVSLAFAAGSIAGCGGGGGTISQPAPTPTVATTASPAPVTSQTVAASFGGAPVSISLASVSGISLAFNEGAAVAGSGTANVTLSTTPPANVSTSISSLIRKPASVGVSTAVAYVTVTSTALGPITLPGFPALAFSFSPIAGSSYNVGFFDSANSTIGWNPISGAALGVNSATIAAGTVAMTLQPGEIWSFALYASSSVFLSNSTSLQFAVGTANLNGGASAGLNTVVTFRQPNGLDATLFNTPTIIGPAGFLNNGPAALAGADAGTNKISATFAPAGAPSGGAFAYGFAPTNASPSGSATFAQYAEPFFAKQQLLTGGPPLFPFVRDGTFPSTFFGYSPGLTIFDDTTLATGRYILNVVIPTSTGSQSLTNLGNLTSLALLAAIPAVTGACTHAGANGTVFSANIPPGLVEAIAYVQDATTNSFYSIKTTSSGTVIFTVPDNLGPRGFGKPATASFNSGDAVAISVVGFNYPAFEAGPPGNTLANPTIAGANGQADITMSPRASCTY